jgi:pimeloyl-ACP methyl ester carboxylesterase
MEELARSEGFTVRRLDPIDREGVGDLTATIFYHPDGRTVLAFRGSVTDGDWVTNWNTYSKLPLQQGQIRDAIRMAYEIEKESPGVVFVGHSLGGRLAQVASVATGRPAYAFDSAPIGNWDIPASIMVGAKEVLLGREVTLPGKITRFRNPQDVVSTMTSPLDIKVLNFVETNVGLEGLVNGEIKDAVAYTHSIDQLAQAMQNVALARDEGWVSQVLKEQADALLGRPRANDDLPPSLMSQISQIYGSDRETSGLVGSWSGSASAGGTSISLRWEISNGDPDIFVGQVIMKLPSDSSWSTYNAAGKVGGKIVTFTGAGWVTKANQNFCLAKYTGTLSETTSGTLLVGSWGPHPIHPNGCPEGARGPFRLTRNEP